MAVDFTRHANVCLVDSSVEPAVQLGKAAAPLVVIQGAPTVPLGSSSGNVANALAAATLGAAAGLTTFITGFQCTASGSTAALAVTVTVAGVVGGTESFTFVFPIGAMVAANPLLVNFPTPLAASAQNTAIVVTLPAGGTGNTNAACSAQGFRQ